MVVMFRPSRSERRMEPSFSFKFPMLVQYRWPAALSIANPSGNFLAQSTQAKLYNSFPPNVSMAPYVIGNVGGSQPHTNFQPYLCVDFIISLFGIYPTPT